MNKKIKCILLGLIGSLIGNGIIFFFFAFTSSKYGTLADWVSGIGTVAAIFFVYLQIDEQKREFKEETSSKVSISFSKQFTMENVEIGKIPGEPKYYIWAVNTGLSSGSFIFLGFCRKEDFKYIRDEKKTSFITRIMVCYTILSHILEMIFSL